MITKQGLLEICLYNSVVVLDGLIAVRPAVLISLDQVQTVRKYDLGVAQHIESY